MNVYAQAGSSFQQVGGDCPDGWTLMEGERPSAAHVAQADGVWGAQAQSQENLSTAERMWRDTKLAGLIWLRDRHRDQLEIDAPSTLTPEQFVDLLMFMQALRDWPQSELFPSVEHRPLSPAWLADLAP